jgi:hypothetical protein
MVKFEYLDKWLEDTSILENENIGNYSISLNLVNDKIMKISIKDNNNYDVYSTNVNLSTIKSTKKTEKEKNEKIRISGIKINGIVSELKPNLSFLSNKQKYALIRNIFTDNTPDKYIRESLISYIFLYYEHEYFHYDEYDNEYPILDNVYNYTIKKEKKKIIITFFYSYIYSFAVKKQKWKDYENEYTMLRVPITENFTITLNKDKLVPLPNNYFHDNDDDIKYYV